MGQLKPYPRYKESGIEWIGKIPEHWETKRLKYSVKLVNEKTGTQNGALNYIGLENIESWTGRIINNQTDDEGDVQGNVFNPGDVLFGKLRPYLAKALRADNKGICTSELLVLRPSDVEQIYLFYCLLNRDFVNTVNASTYGAKMPRANWDFIGNLLLQIPNRDEQTQIASFLDHETSRIDTLVAKKERQIELLKEKRSALITHAVTKGLDPNVKMKDSGVDWIGEIPDGWQIKRAKYLVSKIGSGKTPKGGSEVYVDSGVMLLRSQNIHFDGLRLDDVVFIDEEIDAEMASTRVAEMDVLLNITGASIGRVSIYSNVNGHANVNQHVCILRPDKDKIEPSYLWRSISSDLIQSQIMSNQNGTSREGLNFQQVGNLHILVPKEQKEQSEIASFLDRETTKIDKLISKVQNSIETLKEYRAAIISAAVTGKIDVRKEVL